METRGAKYSLVILFDIDAAQVITLCPNLRGNAQWTVLEHHHRILQQGWFKFVRVRWMWCTVANATDSQMRFVSCLCHSWTQCTYAVTLLRVIARSHFYDLTNGYYCWPTHVTYTLLTGITQPTRWRCSGRTTIPAVDTLILVVLWRVDRCLTSCSSITNVIICSLPLLCSTSFSSLTNCVNDGDQLHPTFADYWGDC